MFASQCDATKRNLDVRTLLSQVKNAPVNEDFAGGQTEAFAPLGIKVKLNQRCKLAWNIKNMQIFSSAYFIWLFHQYLFKWTFLLHIWAPQGTAMLVGLLPKRTEKDWLVTYLTLLSHILAWFVTSLIKTAGHKITAVTVAFLWFLHQMGQEIEQKPAVWIFLFHSCR